VGGGKSAGGAQHRGWPQPGKQRTDNNVRLPVRAGVKRKGNTTTKLGKKNTSRKRGEREIRTSERGEKKKSTECGTDNPLWKDQQENRKGEKDGT